MAEKSDNQGGRDERAVAGIPAAKVRPPLPLGVRRDRLIRFLVDGSPGVRIVEGLAGSGKTTVLGHAAQTWAGRSLWVTADGSDRVGSRFARALGSAAGLTQTSVASEPADPADAAFGVLEALEARPEPTLVVIDDAHELAGAPPADIIDLLCRYRPSHVTLVLGVRHLRGLDHWRWQPYDVRELNGDSLRFRLWEVETLFRDHYGEALGAEELHAVTRLTDGWAVALHLYHVATRTLPAAGRRQLVTGPRLTVRSLREYLAEQVLATVDAEQRNLLRRIAVLDRIRSDRCDRLLERRGCADQLRQLAEVGLLLPEADGHTYRLHELLRAHLLGELDDELGAAGVAGLHRLAADVLEEEGDIVEAVRACGRGGDWDGVRRLLAHDDSPVVLSGPWVEDVPSHLRDTDPWILRAIGRRQMGEGDLDGARTTLATSLERFQEDGGDGRTQRSLRVLEGWLHPDPGQQRIWTECLRTAFSGRAVETWPDEPLGWLGQGLAALAVGRMRVAVPLLRRAATTLTDELGTLAELGLCLAATFGEPDPMPAADRALSRARFQGAPTLVAVAESLAAYAAGGIVDPAFQIAAARERQDVLGEGVHALVAGLMFLEHTLPAAGESLDHAAERFRSAGLLVPAALARAASVLAQAHDERASGANLDAEVSAARLAGPLPQALALLARGLARGDATDEVHARELARQNGFEVLLARLQREGAPPSRSTIKPTRIVLASPAPVRALGGLPDLTADGSQVEASGDPRSAVLERRLELRCMGELQVSLDGVECDVGQLRPRHQELLSILVVHPNAWLHREKLFGWLWPDTTTEKATRNLQVAISAVRKLVEPAAVLPDRRVIARNGERYRMVVAERASDVCRLETALGTARAALRAADVLAAAGSLEAALAEWRGEPAAWVGPADWAVDRRRQLSHEVGEAAVAVVGALAAQDEWERAAHLAARAVDVDLWDDRLWRLAVTSASEAGSTVLAASLEERYRTLVGS